MMCKSSFLVKQENYSTTVGSKSNNNSWGLTKSPVHAGSCASFSIIIRSLLKVVKKIQYFPFPCAIRYIIDIEWFQIVMV